MERDSYGKKAGKGPLIQWELSATLGANQDQTLFVWSKPSSGGKASESVVRRLTPLETERLQGFYDEWSKYGIDENGKVYELSDSARYRLQGNSICRPFWTWLMRRIAAQYERPATLGSLFDGQGGFVLCAKEVGMKTLWVSEIEKHASAVTRYHFGDEELGIEGDL